MKIGELAALSGVSTKTIRYYESIGLLQHPARLANNYRHYDVADLTRLRFIAGARMLGLDIETISVLKAQFDTNQAPCVAVQASLTDQLTRIDEQIRTLLALRQQIIHLQHEGALRPIDPTGQTCICSLVAEQGHTETVPRFGKEFNA